MTLVVDTNVILSALIKDSETRRIIVTIDQDLFAPESILKEVRGHSDLIQEKSGLDEEEVSTLLRKLFEYIHLIPDEQLEPNLPKARKELEDIDPDDIVFLSAALTVDGSIWSDDSDLRRQNLVPVFTTSEIIREFGS